MSVGARIIELRKERNLSQGQLATALEVSRQAVSKWENGLAVPDTQKMIRLAEVLDTEVEYLATGRKGTSPSPAPTLRETKTITPLGQWCGNVMLTRRWVLQNQE